MYKPPGSFDLLIKQMLDNVQRGADATAQRFGMQREERLIGEQAEREDTRMQQQRAWQVDDIRQARDDQLTDSARTYRLNTAQNLYNLLPYMDPDDEDASVIKGLVETLGTPSTATGEAAWQEAMNMNVTLSDGSTVALPLYMAQLQRRKEGKAINDAAVSQLLNDAIAIAGDWTLSVETRTASVRFIMGLDVVSDDLKRSLLGVAGIVDQATQDAILAKKTITEQEIELGGINIRQARQNLIASRAEYNEWVANAEYRDSKLRDEAYMRGQQMGLTDAQQFFEAGILPTTDDGKERLADSLGMGVDELAATGETIFGRVMRQAQAQTTILEKNAIAAGQTVDINKLTIRMKKHELDRAEMLDALKDHQEMATWIAEAVLRGDVEALEMLQAQQDIYPDQLGAGVVNWASVMKQANDVRGDANAVRANNVALSNYSVTHEAVVAAAGVDDYVDKYASTLTPTMLDAEFDPDTGTYPKLEAAIDTWLGNMAKRDIDRLGGEEALRGKLRDAATRKKAVQDYDEAGAALKILIDNPPMPDNKAARDRWRNQISLRVAELGLDPDEWDVIATNIADGKDLDVRKQQADMRLANQQADNYYQSTVGQWIDNQTHMWTLDALQGGAAGLDVESVSKNVSMLKSAYDASADFRDSPYCTVPSGDASMATDPAGRQFVADLPECQAAAERADSLSQVMNLLSTSLLTGGDGSLVFDPARGNTMTAEQVDAAVNPPRPAAELTDFMTRAYGSIDGFDADTYEMLPPNIKNIIGDQIWNNGMHGEELQRFITTAVNLEAVGANPLAPSSKAPTIAESQLPVDSPDWWNASVAERVPQLEATYEWQNIAAAIGNSGFTWEDLLDPNNVAALQSAYPGIPEFADMAAMFGFWRPVQPRVEEGQPPPQAASGGRDEAPPDRRGLKGIFQAIGDAALDAWDSTKHTIGQAARDIGGVASGVYYGGPPPVSPTAGYEPDVETFLEAIDTTKNNMLDNQRQVYMLSRRGGMVRDEMEAERTRGQAEAEQPERRSAFGQMPTRATAEGGGDPGTYVMPSDKEPDLLSPTEAGGVGKATPAADLRVTSDGLQAIRKHESFSPKAYWDVNGWAVGYGQHDPSFTENTTVTREEAERLLENHVAGVEATIKSVLPDVPLTPLQFDALVSFVYNVGSSAFQHSELAAKLKAGDYLGAAAEFDRWNTADGEVLPALTARRAAEKAMFLKGTLPPRSLTAPAVRATVTMPPPSGTR